MAVIPSSNLRRFLVACTAAATYTACTCYNLLCMAVVITQSCKCMVMELCRVQEAMHLTGISLFLQRISVAVQRGNAAAVLGSMGRRPDSCE